jgi:hypothetical protein
VSFSHRLSLKFVAAAVILGGNCFVCPTMVPSVLAAEDRPIPAVDECADEAVVSDAPIDVPLAPAGSSAVAVGAHHPPASECPMGAGSDGLHANSSAGIESPAGKIFLFGRLSAVPGIRPQLSPLQSGIGLSGQLSPPDRAPTLTGTTIKNE